MKRFSDFNVKVSERFIGDKIKISRVLNQTIIVKNYKVSASRFSNSNSRDCLTMQITFNEEDRVLFTGSKVLMEMITQIPKSELPFETIIIKRGESYQFS